mmetsp:Transcript_65315/g.136808  ORF Transcript_65315/g.136808 Transcript_65315/m.136808 type:complete len:95 (+) Transcript_65315:14-298(+)
MHSNSNCVFSCFSSSLLSWLPLGSSHVCHLVFDRLENSAWSAHVFIQESPANVNVPTPRTFLKQSCLFPSIVIIRCDDPHAKIDKDDTAQMSLV